MLISKLIPMKLMLLSYFSIRKKKIFFFSSPIQTKQYDAQVEWNKYKWNEEYLKEKTEEYLEIFNQSVASSGQNLARTTSSVPSEERLSKNKENETSDEEDWNHLDEFDDDDDDQEAKEKNPKKIFYSRKRKPPVDDEIIEDPTQLPALPGGPLQPLDKQKRQPAQQRVYNELSDINQRIASLVQVKQMGLSTPENHKQLKQLMKDRKVKAFQLKRLQSRQRASNKYRVKQRKIVKHKFSSFDFRLFFFSQVEHLFETKPELRPQLRKLYRREGGKPRIEEQCPDLLQIIEEIAKVGGATDDRRRSQIIRPCLTLDDLREKIKQRGYDIKRSTLYYR